MKKTFAAISLLLSVSGLDAQVTYFCGQVKAREKLFSQYEGAEVHALSAQQSLEEETEEYLSNRGGGEDFEIYYIPVVFHIIHDNGVENIPDANIYDCLSVLNRDFRKQNPDTSGIVDAFEDIASDVRIEFRLATRDPDGDCHPGINRINSPLTYDGYDDDMKDLSYWPRNSYLNIWVCNAIGDNTAGFTNLPGDVSSPWLASVDGIVLKYNYVGSLPPSSPFTSRTLTHEVGHWLNLYHTWGPGNSPGDEDNCGIDDLVSDTPNTIGWTTCDLDGASCGSEIDNVQNYMEYSYCSRMFTWGQRQRMRAALTSSTAQRNQLITQANLIETGVIDPPLCIAKFTSPTTSVCLGDTVQFFDASYHGVLQWSWNFGDGTTFNGTDPELYKNPEHIYAEPGIYTVTLEVSNGDDELTTSVTSFITVYEPGQLDAPFTEGFEGSWPAGNWSIYNESLDETWEVTPTAQFSGDKSLKLRNFNNEVSGNYDVFYSATYDMSAATTIYLSYKWAYANKTDETDDMLRISVSGDCGQTWQVRKIRKGLSNLPTADPTNAQFTPTTTDQWDGETLTLSQDQWFTSNFRVRFEFTGEGGNNIFIDDINITAEMTVSIGENEAGAEWNVYPNPAAGEMTLEMTHVTTQKSTLLLYDTAGKLCYIYTTGLLSPGRHVFTIPDMQAGIYLLQVRNAFGTGQQKIIFE